MNNENKKSKVGLIIAIVLIILLILFLIIAHFYRFVYIFSVLSAFSTVLIQYFGENHCVVITVIALTHRNFLKACLFIKRNGGCIS